MVDILQPNESEKYLGRVLSLGAYHATEFSHRMSAAWRAFAKFKHILCSKKFKPASRFKLFESIVTPTALYGSACWTITADTRSSLRTTWRKMVRKIVQVPRREKESWVMYIKRATRECEKCVCMLGGHDWVYTQDQRKRQFAEATATNNRGKRSSRLLTWKPFFRTVACRPWGRPRKRWGDFQ